MRALTILQRCRDAKSEIRRIDARIERRREAMGAFGGIRMDADGGSKSTDGGDRMSRFAAEIDELERERQDRKDAQSAEAASAMQLIDLLPDEEGDVIHRYYLLRQTWSDIAREKRYDRKWVTNKKKNAEAALDALSTERVEATLPRWYLEKWKEE